MLQYYEVLIVLCLCVFQEVNLHRSSSDAKLGLTLCYGSLEDEVTDIFISEVRINTISTLSLFSNSKIFLKTHRFFTNFNCCAWFQSRKLVLVLFFVALSSFGMHHSENSKNYFIYEDINIQKNKKR